MQLYLSSVYGFSSWAAVVLWRIASYQVVLAVTGIAFLLLTHRSTKGVQPKKGVKDANRSPEIVAPEDISGLLDEIPA